MPSTATDPFDMPGYFAPIGDELELAAPGVEVLSTIAGGNYDLLSGTSQAAPHVTGAAGNRPSATKPGVTRLRSCHASSGKSPPATALQAHIESPPATALRAHIESLPATAL